MYSFTGVHIALSKYAFMFFDISTWVDVHYINESRQKKNISAVATQRVLCRWTWPVAKPRYACE